jgi:CHAT domain-containing protein
MEIAAALREAQLWIRGLTIGAVVECMERWRRWFPHSAKTKLDQSLLHYRYQNRENPNCHPFAHPSYWAAFTVNGM